MIYLWIVNIAVAVVFFVLWHFIFRRHVLALAIPNVYLIMPLIIVGLYMIPVVISLSICFFIFRYLSVELVSFSLWPVYAPHSLVAVFCLIQFYLNRKKVYT